MKYISGQYRGPPGQYPDLGIHGSYLGKLEANQHVSIRKSLHFESQQSLLLS